MFCPRCKKNMNYTMSFEKDKTSKYYKCPNCFYETKRKNLLYTEIFNKFFETNQNNIRGVKDKNEKRNNL